MEAPKIASEQLARARLEHILVLCRGTHGSHVARSVRRKEDGKHVDARELWLIDSAVSMAS